MTVKKFRFRSSHVLVFMHPRVYYISLRGLSNATDRVKYSRIGRERPLLNEYACLCDFCYRMALCCIPFKDVAEDIQGRSNFCAVPIVYGNFYCLDLTLCSILYKSLDVNLNTQLTISLVTYPSPSS